jgi:hypothetical protein
MYGNGSLNQGYSYEDTPGDLVMLRRALRRLPAIKEELGGVHVSETNRQRKEFIINELDTLEETLSGVLIPVRNPYYLASHLTTFWLLEGQLLHDERGQPQQSWHSSKLDAHLP